jgi:hypothetical protein
MNGFQTALDHSNLSADADTLLAAAGTGCISIVIAAAFCALVWSLISRATRVRMS